MPTPRKGYSLNGKKVPSVTTIIGRYKDPGALSWWIWDCGRKGLDYKKEGRNAANIGTAAHDAIERSIRGEDQVPEPTKHYELAPGGRAKAKACFQAWQRWNALVKPGYIDIEPQFVHPTHGYGGTIDAIARIDGRLFIVDWKTSNAIYSETIMQLAAYKALWEVNTGDVIGGACVLRMDKKTGKYEQFYAPDLFPYWQHFLRLLDLWKRDKELFPCDWEKTTEHKLALKYKRGELP